MVEGFEVGLTWDWVGCTHQGRDFFGCMDVYHC